MILIKQKNDHEEFVPEYVPDLIITGNIHQIKQDTEADPNTMEECKHCGSLRADHCNQHVQDKLGNGNERKNLIAEWDDHDVDGCRKWQTSDAETRPIQCTEDLPEGEQKTVQSTKCPDTEDFSHLQQFDGDIDLPLNGPENRDSESDGQRDTYKMPLMLESNQYEIGIVDEKELRLKYPSAKTTVKKLSGSAQDEIIDTNPLEIAQYLKIPSSSRQQLQPQVSLVFMLHMAQQFPTPVAEKQPNEGPSFPEGCQSEMNRLGTYTDYPQSSPVYAIKLAGNGFVWRSEFGSVDCNFCRLRISLSELKMIGNGFIKMHRERSSGCPLNVGAECGNEPVPKIEQFSQQQVSSKTRASEVANNSVERLSEASYQPDMATVLPSPSVQQQEARPSIVHSEVADSAPLIQQPQLSTAPAPRNVSSSSRQNRSESSHTAAPSAEGARSTNSNSPRSSTKPPRSSSKPAASNGNAPAATGAAAQSSPSNKSNGSSGGKVEQPKEKKKLTYSDLGIFAEKPKRADMAVMQKRLSTFTGKWKDSYTQTPKMLADAGMYYAG